MGTLNNIRNKTIDFIALIYSFIFVIYSSYSQTNQKAKLPVKNVLQEFSKSRSALGGPRVRQEECVRKDFRSVAICRRNSEKTKKLQKGGEGSKSNRDKKKDIYRCSLWFY